MELFFQARNGREYILKGDKWKNINSGAFAVEIVNALLGEQKETLIKMTMLAEEKKAVQAAWAILEFAYALAAKRGARKLETDIEYLPVWKEESRKSWGKAFGGVFSYLTGQNETLWELWQQPLSVVYSLPWTILPFPDNAVFFYLCTLNSRPWTILPAYIKGRGVGWYCIVNNALEAAVREVVLSFMHGWKVRFKVCRECGRLYYEACPHCQAEQRHRKDFLNLLRVHLSREAKKKPPEAREEIKREINRIRGEIAKHGVTRKILDDYLSVCKDYSLPTEWYKNRL